MRLRWLLPIGAILYQCLVVHGAPEDAAKPSVGVLVCPRESPQGVSQNEVLPYDPRPGDIVLCDNHSKLHHFVFKFAKTKAPIHASMVIAREDGTPVLLELTGPTLLSAKVCILDLEQRLSTYPGDVMIRRIREPLSTEQCDEMIRFARSQVGKTFAIGRVVLQGSPFNAHCGMRRMLFGNTYFNRHRWFCSELVVAAGTKAHLFEPDTMPANATFPRDLAFDETRDLSALYHPPAPWVVNKASVK